MVKAAFIEKKKMFAIKPDFNLKNKILKPYIWNIAYVYGAYHSTLRKMDHKYHEEC
jgi:hypothetical protein